MGVEEMKASEDGREECQRRGGDLAVIRAGQDNEKVRDIVRGLPIATWMGLKRSGSDRWK